jgi:predicted lipoprotein with Yx(FWY)xxD motif
MRLTAVLVSVLVGLSAGCGADDEPTTATEATGTPPTSSAPSPSPSGSAESSSPSPEQSAPTGLVVRTADSDFGRMLFDARGQAIYLFDKESTSRAECYGECARAWPPVLTDGEPQAEGSARAGLLGTTQRRDGSTQVTYAGHPLYYYAHEGPNQVLCHDVVEYGGRWLVVTPAGDPAA